MALALVATAVPVGIFWTGGVSQASMAALLGLAAGAFIAALPHRSYQKIPNPLAWIWFTLAAWSTLTLVPLPRDLVTLLHADAVAISDASRAALLLAPLPSMPIAIAPAEAAFQVALYGVGAALALTAGLLLNTGEGRRTAAYGLRAMLWVPIIAGILWILAWSPWLSGAMPADLPKLLRQFVPVNANHVAALLTAGLGIALGSRAISSVEQERARWTYLAVGYAALIVMIPSRGGIVGALFIFALAGARGPTIRKQMRTGEPIMARQRRIRGALKTLVVLTVLGTLGLPILEQEFGGTFSLLQQNDIARDGKLRGFSLVAPRLMEGWPVGQGAGSLPVRILMENDDVSLRYQFAENIVLDRSSGQGLPFSLFFWAATLWVILVPTLRWKPLGVHLPAFVAICGFLIHDLVDFSLEMAGGLLPFLAIGTLLDRLRPTTWFAGNDDRRWLPGPIATKGAAAVALMIAIFSLTLSWDRRNHELKTAFDGVDAESMTTLVADNYTGEHHAFYRLGRARLSAGDREGAERAFTRAVELKPASTHARLFLAQTRIALGKPAADLINSLLGVSIEMRARIIDVALRRPWGEQELIAAVVAQDRFAEAVAIGIVRERPDVVDRIVRALRKAKPNQRFAAEATLAGIYVRRGDYDQARIVAAALLGDPATELAGLQLLARVAMFSGNHKRAFLLYRDVCDRDGSRFIACEHALHESLTGATPDEAITYIRNQFPRLRQSNHGNALYWTVLAQAYLRAKQGDDAVAAARRAMGYGAKNLSARTVAVRAMLKVGNWRGAQSEIERMRADNVASGIVVDLSNEVSKTRGVLH